MQQHDSLNSLSLPDPLIDANGKPVASADDWRRRRGELLELFRTHVYGRTPTGHVAVEVSVVESADDALGGIARRRQIRLAFGEQVRINVLMYLPQTDAPVPVALGLNFRGNHAVHADPAIGLAECWLPSRDEGVVNNRATDAGRGVAASRWPVEQILARGYALVTACYCDIAPDHADLFRTGVHSLFASASEGPDAWGAIGAWAWGLSRIMDYLQTDASVDARRVVLMGHSRLGKAALWAGAQDERFAIVISNNSGCGGAALSRVRTPDRETVARINAQFPHWFCKNFHAYNDRVDELPVDQHQLLALIAPRPVYVASAVEDRWACPEAEFASAARVGPVYQLLGREPLPTSRQPPLDTPVAGHIGYHIRTGGHDVNAFDWKCFLDFAGNHLRDRR